MRALAPLVRRSPKEGAPPVARGIDVALVGDGRIKKLHTMLL
jgi:hypothetical protein